MTSLPRRIKSTTALVLRALASDKFLYLIVLVAAIQGLWYALSFQLAHYDEAMHFDFTRMYTEQISPFISEQKPKWDILGDTIREPSYLFYYLMSWPLRIFMSLTDSLTLQVILMRLITIAIFCASLFYFRKAFVLAGSSKPLANLALLFFILTPGVAILPGVYNYDNLIILLTAILLYLSIRIIRDQQVNVLLIGSVLVIGLLGSLVKIVFLPIFATIFIFLAYDQWSKHRKRFVPLAAKSFRGLSKGSRVSLVFIGVLAIILFGERVLVNVVAYRDFTPSCTAVHSTERCNKDPIQRRNIKNKADRAAMGNNFQPDSPGRYFLVNWAPVIISHHASPGKVLPVMERIYFSAALLGSIIILLYARSILGRNRSFQLLAVVLLFFSLSVLYANYSYYARVGMAIAMNGRYLFPVLPIFILFLGISITRLFKHRQSILSFVLIALMLLMTQGGGMITYILDNYESVYWQNETVLQVNSAAKKIISPLVKE